MQERGLEVRKQKQEVVGWGTARGVRAELGRELQTPYRDTPNGKPGEQEVGRQEGKGGLGTERDQSTELRTRRGVGGNRRGQGAGQVQGRLQTHVAQERHGESQGKLEAETPRRLARRHGQGGRPSLCWWWSPCRCWRWGQGSRLGLCWTRGLHSILTPCLCSPHLHGFRGRRWTPRSPWTPGSY